MKILNNIIVGLDISQDNTNILQRAFSLADKKHTKVTIVHAIETNVKDNALKIIKDQVSNINIKNIDCSIIIENKEASLLIIEAAKSLNAEIIITGINKEKQSDVSIFSTTAQKIAQKSRIPLLIIKRKHTINSIYSNIVSFCDLSKPSLSSSIYAKELFELETIKIVYAYKQMGEIALSYYNEDKNKNKIKLGKKEKENTKFKKFIDQHNIINAEIIESNFSVSDSIIEYVNSNKNDLVVLSSKGLSPFSTFLFGSTTSFLMDHLETDLLIYVTKD